VADAPPREKITMLAVSLAVGIAIGWSQPGAVVWPWLAASGLALALVVGLWRRDRRIVLSLVAAATVCFGAAWIAVRHDYVATNDLAAWVGEDRALVRIRGDAVEAPVLRDRTAGSMTLFDHRLPATYFSIRVRALVGRDGTETPARGTVLVRVEQAVVPFRAGDRIETEGVLFGPAPPANPGGFDYVSYARSRGRAGMVNVPSRDLLVVAPGPRASWRGAWLRWREDLRRRAGGWLLADLPSAHPGGDRDALLAALLLGRRGPELDGLGETFRNAGLAHFLAISGLHLGVMAGFVFALARLAGAHGRWHGWLVIVVVLVYLTIVEVRLPVLRAGLMTIAACVGMAGGRRLQTAGLVAASAVALLLWQPQQLFGPGFQLSYGVVLGLIHLAPRLRARWFGRPDRLASSSAEMAGQWLRTAAAAAMTAWMVSSPIALFHWGVLWPMAAPFSVAVLPVVSVVLVLGYIKMVLAVSLPSAGLLLGVPLSLGADVLVALVRAMDTVPGSVVRLTYPAAVWSVLAETWVWTWVLFEGRVWGGHRARRVIAWAGVLLLVVLLAPPAARRVGWGRPALQITMLSVGDGSCFVLRSAGSTVLFTPARPAISTRAGARLCRRSSVWVSARSMPWWSATPTSTTTRPCWRSPTPSTWQGCSSRRSRFALPSPSPTAR
jgi:competence protein ComEC